MNATEFRESLNNAHQTESDVVAILAANYFTLQVPAAAGVFAEYAVTKPPLDYLKLMPRSAVFIVGGVDVVSPPFDANVLQVTPYADISADLHDLPALELPVDGGPSLMVTTQLSGCTLVYQPSTSADPVVRIIHIRPPPGSNALEVCKRIRHSAPRFAGQAVPALTWGRENHGDTNVNLIAVRLDRKWTLYGQIVNASRTVLEVRRISLHA